MNAVLEFDDMLCRRVMVPRTEVEFLEVDATLAECLAMVHRAKHTRYPVCEASLDRVLGVVHLKDLVGADPATTDLRALMRPPRYVPESMPISKLLRHFQTSRQHLAMVLDEYGTVTGVVTLENVLEQIVGPVEDEFDLEEPEVVPQGDGIFAVRGGTALAHVNRKTGLALRSDEADTMSGLLTALLGRLADVGDTVALEGASARVLEVRSGRADRVLLSLASTAEADDP